MASRVGGSAPGRSTNAAQYGVDINDLFKNSFSQQRARAQSPAAQTLHHGGQSSGAALQSSSLSFSASQMSSANIHGKQSYGHNQWQRNRPQIKVAVPKPIQLPSMRSLATSAGASGPWTMSLANSAEEETNSSAENAIRRSAATSRNKSTNSVDTQPAPVLKTRHEHQPQQQIKQQQSPQSVAAGLPEHNVDPEDAVCLVKAPFTGGSGHSTSRISIRNNMKSITTDWAAMDDEDPYCISQELEQKPKGVDLSKLIASTVAANQAQRLKMMQAEMNNKPETTHTPVLNVGHTTVAIATSSVLSVTGVKESYSNLLQKNVRQTSSDLSMFPATMTKNTLSIGTHNDFTNLPTQPASYETEANQSPENDPENDLSTVVQVDRDSYFNDDRDSVTRRESGRKKNGNFDRDHTNTISTENDRRSESSRNRSHSRPVDTYSHDNQRHTSPMSHEIYSMTHLQQFNENSHSTLSAPITKDSTLESPESASLDLIRRQEDIMKESSKRARKRRNDELRREKEEQEIRARERLRLLEERYRLDDVTTSGDQSKDELEDKPYKLDHTDSIAQPSSKAVQIMKRKLATLVTPNAPTKLSLLQSQGQPHQFRSLTQKVDTYDAKATNLNGRPVSDKKKDASVASVPTNTSTFTRSKVRSRGTNTLSLTVATTFGATTPAVAVSNNYSNKDKEHKLVSDTQIAARGAHYPMPPIASLDAVLSRIKETLSVSDSARSRAAYAENNRITPQALSVDAKVISPPSSSKKSRETYNMCELGATTTSDVTKELAHKKPLSEKEKAFYQQQGFFFPRKGKQGEVQVASRSSSQPMQQQLSNVSMTLATSLNDVTTIVAKTSEQSMLSGDTVTISNSPPRSHSGLLQSPNGILFSPSFAREGHLARSLSKRELPREINLPKDVEPQSLLLSFMVDDISHDEETVKNDNSSRLLDLRTTTSIDTKLLDVSPTQLSSPWTSSMFATPPLSHPQSSRWDVTKCTSAHNNTNSYKQIIHQEGQKDDADEVPEIGSKHTGDLTIESEQKRHVLSKNTSSFPVQINGKVSTTMISQRPSRSSGKRIVDPTTLNGSEMLSSLQRQQQSLLLPPPLPPQLLMHPQHQQQRQWQYVLAYQSSPVQYMNQLAQFGDPPWLPLQSGQQPPSSHSFIPTSQAFMTPGTMMPSTPRFPYFAPSSHPATPLSGNVDSSGSRGVQQIAQPFNTFGGLLSGLHGDKASYDHGSSHQTQQQQTFQRMPTTSPFSFTPTSGSISAAHQSLPPPPPPLSLSPPSSSFMGNERSQSHPHQSFPLHRHINVFGSEFSRQTHPPPPPPQVQKQHYSAYIPRLPHPTVHPLPPPTPIQYASQHSHVVQMQTHNDLGFLEFQAQTDTNRPFIPILPFPSMMIPSSNLTPPPMSMAPPASQAYGSAPFLHAGEGLLKASPISKTSTTLGYPQLHAHESTSQTPLAISHNNKSKASHLDQTIVSDLTNNREGDSQPIQKHSTASRPEVFTKLLSSTVDETPTVASQASDATKIISRPPHKAVIRTFTPPRSFQHLMYPNTSQPQQQLKHSMTNNDNVIDDDNLSVAARSVDELSNDMVSRQRTHLGNSISTSHPSPPHYQHFAPIEIGAPARGDTLTGTQ